MKAQFFYKAVEVLQRILSLSTAAQQNGALFECSNCCFVEDRDYKAGSN